MYPEQRQLQVDGPWGGRTQRLERSARALWLLSLALTAGLALYPSSGLMTGEMLQVRKDYWAHVLVWIWLAALPYCFEPRRGRASRLAILVLPYGIALEALQHLTPGRTFEFADIVCDALGTVLGMGLGLLLARLRRA